MDLIDFVDVIDFIDNGAFSSTIAGSSPGFPGFQPTPDHPPPEYQPLPRRLMVNNVNPVNPRLPIVNEVNEVNRVNKVKTIGRNINPLWRGQSGHVTTFPKRLGVTTISLTRPTPPVCAGRWFQGGGFRCGGSRTDSPVSPVPGETESPV
jgi:hypothetical protein